METYKRTFISKEKQFTMVQWKPTMLRKTCQTIISARGQFGEKGPGLSPGSTPLGKALPRSLRGITHGLLLRTYQQFIICRTRLYHLQYSRSHRNRKTYQHSPKSEKRSEPSRSMCEVLVPTKLLTPTFCC